MLSRVAPWLASRNQDGLGVRVLGNADTLALRELARQDVVANVFILAHLESSGTAAPTSGGASVFGVFDGGYVVHPVLLNRHPREEHAFGAAAQSLDQFAVARMRRGMALLEQLHNP